MFNTNVNKIMIREEDNSIFSCRLSTYKGLTLCFLLFTKEAHNKYLKIYHRRQRCTPSLS